MELPKNEYSDNPLFTQEAFLKKTVVFLMAMVFLICIDIHAEDQWKLAKQSDGIKVYTMKDPQGKAFDIFKGVCDVDAPWEVVLEVLKDLPSYTKWFPNCKESRLLKRDEKNNSVVYMVISPGWPVADRDVVFYTLNYDSPEKVEHTISLNYIKDSDGIVPRNKDYVRMLDIGGGYVLKRINKNKTTVAFTNRSDLGGNIPVSLVNFMAVDIPFKSLKGIREMVKNDEYYKKAGVKK
jgi:hypothetical protein